MTKKSKRIGNQDLELLKEFDLQLISMECGPVHPIETTEQEALKKFYMAVTDAKDQLRIVIRDLEHNTNYKNWESL